HSLAVFSVCMFVLGVVSGITMSIGTFLITHIYEGRQRGSRLLFTDSFFSMAGTVFPVIAGMLLARHLPWYWVYVCIGVIYLAIFLLTLTVEFPVLGKKQHDAQPVAKEKWGVGVLLLKPFGLHHILLAMVRFTPAGGIEMVNGQEVAGALNIFYAELKAGLPFSPHVTAFLSQGFMPTFIFGLPAVAYAIYRTARPENRPVIKGLLLSGVLVSVVTGISEPIEFLFLFIAPVLYAFHIVMSGLALMVMALLGVTIGNTDGGILDLLIFGVMQGMSTKWYLLFPVGIAWFAIYFFVFRWYILRHDIKTPGREVDAQGALQAVEANTRARGKSKYDHGLILRALGGKENIESLDNCITRLRLVVKDMGLIDQQALKAAGALSVVVLDAHSVQVIIGPQVQSVKSGIEALI
ncbi:MAG: MFS transporter, partial [Enterobacter hormaechei]|nr:MFS transporter [Enterobacter hormaechei]